MSYSDYGGLCWKFQDGEKPERYKAAEDASLHSEGPGDNRPIEKATGLKFDALLKADPNYCKMPEDVERAIKLDDEPEHDKWITAHAHHVVIGNMEGIALINHKGRVFITINGEVMKECGWNDTDDGPSYHGGVAVPYDSPMEVKWAISMLTDPYVSFNWIRYPDGTNYLAVGGYAVGEHWWLDEENNAMEYVNEEWVPGDKHYPTEAEWLDKIVPWYEEARKDSGLV